MGYGIDYINGVIAVKEKSLLGEKILRFPTMTQEEVKRALRDSGFGSAGGGEDPVRAEEEALDAFIREYAPTEADKIYFLAPRDFHNMKALYKAERLGADPAPMLGPEGLKKIGELKELVAAKRPPVPDLPEGATGAEIGAAFDRAEFAYLLRACRRRSPLKRFLEERADRTNLLTAFRAGDRARAEALYTEGGTLGKETLAVLFSEDAEKRERAFAGTPYAAFYAACLRAGKPPFTEAERMLARFEKEWFREKRFCLEGREPFLYYVLRRRAEIGDVRTALVCLGAGVPPGEIEKRLSGGVK